MPNVHREKNFHSAVETSEVQTDEAASIADTTYDDDVIRSEIYENGFTQTNSATSFAAANDKSSDSIDSSTDSSQTQDSSNTADVGGFMRHKDDVTSNLEHDDSSKLLISDESTNQIEADVDDQPVTTDLTLTKTVELTENEPDPEPELEVHVVELEPESEQQTFNVNKLQIPQPMEMMKYLEEPNDIKEISLNNFESTMDDISDAELESLEQELEDLVAVADQSIDKTSTDIVAKVIEEFAEKANERPKVEETVTEAEEESPMEEKSVKPEHSAPVEKVMQAPEPPPPVEELEDPSEIQEISAVSENENDQRESSASEAHEAVEPTGAIQEPVLADPDFALSTSSTDESTSIQNLPSQSNEDYSINESNSTGSLTSAPDLGRVPPYWIPDEMTNQCMQCDVKFSLIKRRHHCRACGLLLCSNCCNEKFILPYLGNEGRICKSCLETLVKNQLQQKNQPRNPNPANPMEYCSTLPPQQQVNASALQPPTVMVPPGVLKRDNARSSERKSVIFSDGIRPGTDLDETAAASSKSTPEKPPKINMPTLNEKTNSFIPEAGHELPPVLFKEVEFRFVDNNLALIQRLRQEELKFAINKNFYVTVKIVTRKNLEFQASHDQSFIYISASSIISVVCCTNKTVINFSTSGLLAVRQEELLLLLELNDDMEKLPKEVFLHLNEIYVRADKNNAPIKEYGYSQASSNSFLGAFGGESVYPSHR